MIKVTGRFFLMIMMAIAGFFINQTTLLAPIHEFGHYIVALLFNLDPEMEWARVYFRYPKHKIVDYLLTIAGPISGTFIPFAIMWKTIQKGLAGISGFLFGLTLGEFLFIRNSTDLRALEYLLPGSYVLWYAIGGAIVLYSGLTLLLCFIGGEYGKKSIRRSTQANRVRPKHKQELLQRERVGQSNRVQGQRRSHS